MKITDDAKVIINDALKANNGDCLKAIMQKSCCGESIYFTVAKMKAGETTININGIPVLMDSKAQAKAEGVTKTQSGKLIIEDANKPAGGCC